MATSAVAATSAAGIFAAAPASAGTPASVRTVTGPPVVVLSVRAAPSQLPAAGATVTVTGKVGHASSCQLELLSSQSLPVVYSHDAKNCSGGNYSAHVTIGPNSSTRPHTVAFALVARSGTSAFAGRFYVRLAGVPQALVLSASAVPRELPATGATVAVTGRVEHASSCQLRVLSSQSFPVVYSHDARNCAGGSYSAHVTIGPNPTAVARIVALALVAGNVASHFVGRFYVLLAAGHATTMRIPPPPPATTVPATPPTVPVTQSQSSNWSGYAALGGPYKAVKGTFTVPSTVAGASGRRGAQVSEWVGLDGLSSADPSLIQAGVDEFPDPTNPSGFDIQPWWEILPATETTISTVNVAAGDKVSVTIWQVSGTSWEINLTDDTNGQSYTTPPENYTGPGSNAEWVVEATTECQSRCQTAQLAAYSPPVVFSGLGLAGPQEASLQEITMEQGAQDVSSPSPFEAGGFTVTYTGPQA